MKKNLLFSIVMLFVCLPAFSQKELWWVYTGFDSTEPGFPSNYGSIRKVDFDGQNESIVHNFDSINGKLPYGKLFLSSNGKLYGNASQGGPFPGQFPSQTSGALYEYDLILNVFKVATFYGNPQIPTSRIPLTGVVEKEGMLFGTTSGYGSIYKHDLATEITTFGAQIPSFNSNQNEINGELTKAANGMIYGTTKRFSSCPTSNPFLGAIARFNPANNVFTILHPLYCVPTEEGWAPSGGLVEGVPGKLYGTTALGGIHYGAEAHAFYGSGILFEYDIATNTYTKKIDFDVDTNGFSPSPLTLGANGKLYGLLGGYYDPQAPGESIMGSLYEYDIPSNTITVLHDFTWPEAGGQMQGTLMKGSDGNLYGHHKRGIFRFNPITNETGNILESFRVQDLIEVCRKPSYHFFDVDTFDACVGGNFTYDIQNSNATTYQWLKNDNIVQNQTTGILNLTSLVPSDAGNYTCLMTNECGATTTMVLHLTVNCLGTDTFAELDKSIKLYPNPTKDILNVKLPENVTVTINNIKIANSLGQIVREQKTQNNPKIDVSQLQAGIYFISLTTNYGNWNGKFVRE